MPHHAPAHASELGPTLEFEAVLGQLVERAEHMMRSQSRLRDLIRVNNDLTSNLDLGTLLRKIVEIGTELIHAEFGAIGVIGDDRGLEQFITVGMDAETIAMVGDLPEGKGLLGALIADPAPVRLAVISEDIRSRGFPPHHPPMRSFLGVPIRVRDQVYGNLYLTDSRNGEFSADDEELAEALAATAGIAIANARLFDDAKYRERWASALAETARRLMKDDDEHLGSLLERVTELADADLAWIGLVSSVSSDVVIDRAVGTAAEELVGMSLALGQAAAHQAIGSGQPVAIEDLSLLDPDGFDGQGLLGHAMVIPFTLGGGRAGVLGVARLRGRPGFGVRDLDMGTSFASHISVSIDRTEAGMIRRRVSLLEERTRIARDLHDHVIQRLFAAGLSLQAVARTLEPEPAAAVVEQIREIDASIGQIRQSIFALHRDGGDGDVTSVSLRARVLEIVNRADSQDVSSPRPQVTFLGPVDLMSDATLTDDITAVVAEALANVARHAGASRIDVVIAAVAGRVTVEVTDDGVGPGSTARRSGLANLRARADDRGGAFDLLPGPVGGTQLLWSVPA